MKTARTRIGTLLVPTDFSVSSRKALEYASALLQEFDGELHLVHVHVPDYSYSVPALLSQPPLLTAGEIERYHRAELQKLCREYASSDATPPCHAPIGSPFDEICKVAREISADYIVIATRGLTGVKHLLLGSTAERVVRHAPCPVLVVRQREREFAAPKKAGLKIERIVVPVDFSECSRAGVEEAIAFAKATGARLALIHAYQLLPYVPCEHMATYEHMPSPDVIEDAADAQLEEFIATIDFRGVERETAVRCGRAADAIRDFANETYADLIVTSTHGHTGLAHVLIGSVAEHVVRYAPCPVLVIPQREQLAKQS
ncbi:MAG: universal stress protein [Chthoniobacterales bacterium]